MSVANSKKHKHTVEIKYKNQDNNRKVLGSKNIKHKRYFSSLFVGELSKKQLKR